MTWTCRFDEPGCGEDFPCLFCIFQNYSDAGESLKADKLYVDFYSLFEKKGIERLNNNTLFGPSAKVGSTQPKPTGLPASPKQLAYIEALAKRQGIPTPDVTTLQEAKTTIDQLLKDDTKPSERQVHYLRSLAYEKLGSSSEQWVQDKVAAGKKAVSDAITDLKGRR